MASCAAVIAYVSLFTTGQRPPSAGPFWDKQLHFLGYAGFTLVLAYATAHLRERPTRRILLVVGGAVCYGLLMEIGQAPLAARQFSLLDLAANAAGAVAVSVWFLVERRVVAYRRVVAVE
ncbi:MAG: VanZ family protein [Halobaculum sp.]